MQRRAPQGSCEPSRDRIPKRPVLDRPRERLAQCGPAALSDAELLALLIRTGSRGRGALDVAARSLAVADGLRGLASASADELEALAGLGPAAGRREADLAS